MIKKLTISNELERQLIEAKGGKISLIQFLKILLESQLIMPSNTAIKENGAMTPLFFNREGQNMLAVFTSPSLLKMYEVHAKHYLVLSGRDVFKQLPSGVGLVINPGYSEGLDISADGIKSIMKDFLGN